MLKIGSFLISFIFYTLVSAQSISISASVDENQISLGDLLYFTLTLSSNEDLNINSIPLENLIDFEVRSNSQSQSTSISVINGQMTKDLKKTFRYVLRPLKEGLLEIPSFKIKIKGKSFQTESFKIEVSQKYKNRNKKKRAAPLRRFDPFSSDPRDLFDSFFKAPREEKIDINQSVFLEAYLDKNEAYFGERLKLHFYLYVDPSLHLRNYQISYPELKGFWKKNLFSVNKKLVFKEHIYRQKRFKRALVGSFILYPIQKDILKIEAAKIQFQLNSHFFLPSNYEIKSKEKSIRIKDLPEPLAPHFTGGVGQFVIGSQLDKTKLKVGEIAHFNIMITGDGNTPLTHLPDLKIPSVQVLKSEQKEEFLTEDRIKKSFELLLIPEKPGKLVIPEIHLSFFDPIKKKYTQKKIPSVDLEVSGQALEKDESLDQEAKTNSLTDLSSLFSFDIPFFSFNLFFDFYLALLFFFLTLIFILYHLFQKKMKEKNTPHSYQVRHRFNKMDLCIHRKEYREFAKEALNLYQFIFNHIFEISSVNFKTVLEKISPRFDESFKIPFLELLDELEKMAFSEKDPKEFYSKKQLVDILKKMKKQIDEILKEKKIK